ATIPVAWLIIKRVQKLSPRDFDHVAARSGIGEMGDWSIAERRLVPLVAVVVAAWVLAPLAVPYLHAGALTDGTIAVLGAMLLFLIPDGTGRPLLTWKEADRAPWGVIMMFGGGLALASGIGESGLATWVGTALEPLGAVHPVIIALVLVAIVIVVTEFASNVASASSTMPVVAGLALATGADPLLLAMPAAMAASWAFMLPSGTGPNAIAWATGHVALPRLLKAGLMMNLIAPPLIVGIVWMIRTLLG
ncbi:MAG TPA: SLC13 family permease, partial [Sphingomicrobium sp.]|nr:SLC13 family permease [Sphingomicrobium sp.]